MTHHATLRHATAHRTQGSQVWAGSVEIELHYIPEGDCSLPVDSSGGGGEFLGDPNAHGICRDSGSIKRDSGGSSNNNSYPPLSPSSTSLASSFVKAAKALPEKARASGAASEASAAMVQADLLALSPRTARGVESAAAAARGVRYAGRRSDGTEKVVTREGTDGGVAETAGDGSVVAGGKRGRGSWKSFFWGVVCTALFALGALWTFRDPLLSDQFGLGLTVLEDGGAGQQAVVLIHGSVRK